MDLQLRALRVAPRDESRSPEERLLISKVLADSRRRKAWISACVRRGDFSAALNLYGHEQRLPAVIRWFFHGRGPLRDALADAWSSTEFLWSDDGSGFGWIHYFGGSADFLWLWRAIAAGQLIEDRDPLPPGDPLVIYRGQATPDAPLGISWTLDPDVARMFAIRIPRLGTRPHGTVLTGRARRTAILGYLTSRTIGNLTSDGSTDGPSEAEVIVDPADVEIIDRREALPLEAIAT